MEPCADHETFVQRLVGRRRCSGISSHGHVHISEACLLNFKPLDSFPRVICRPEGGKLQFNRFRFLKKEEEEEEEDSKIEFSTYVHMQSGISFFVAWIAIVLLCLVYMYFSSLYL